MFRLTASLLTGPNFDMWPRMEPLESTYLSPPTTLLSSSLSTVIGDPRLPGGPSPHPPVEDALRPFPRNPRDSSNPGVELRAKMTSDTGHSLNLGARADRTLLTRSVVGVMVGVVLGISVLAVSFLPSMCAPLAILAIIFPFLAMIVGDARRLLLAMVLLDIPISLDIHLGNRDEALAFGAIGGLGISVTTVALVGLYAIWIGEL